MRYAVYSEETHDLLGSFDRKDIPHALEDGMSIRLRADVEPVASLAEFDPMISDTATYVAVVLRAIAMRKYDGLYSRETSYMLFTKAEPEMLAKMQGFRAI